MNMAMKCFIFCLLVLIVSLINNGCKKDNSETVTAGFSAKVEGVDWTASKVSAYASAVSASTSITATSTSGEQMVIAFYSHDTGTITFSDSDPFSYAQYITSETEYSTLNGSTHEGQVIITVFDKSKRTISGSFFFTGKNTAGQKKNITEGNFSDVPY
jgi:hypothetical protein